MIAKLADGVFLSSGSLLPGTLSGITIEPQDLRVQAITEITISFTISHRLNSEAALVLRMPSGMTLPTAGSIMQVVSDDGSTPAVNATVLPGNLL